MSSPNRQLSTSIPNQREKESRDWAESSCSDSQQLSGSHRFEFNVAASGKGLSQLPLPATRTVMPPAQQFQCSTLSATQSTHGIAMAARSRSHFAYRSASLSPPESVLSSISSAPSSIFSAAKRESFTPIQPMGFKSETHDFDGTPHLATSACSSSSLSAVATYPNTNWPDPTMAGFTCSKDGGSCMVTVLRLIHTLHAPSLDCLCSGDESRTPIRSPRMTDVVLATNRNVIQVVSTLLKSNCNCVANSQMQLLLTTICTKLLLWYQALVRDHSTQKKREESPSTTSTSVLNLNEDHAEQVLHQPFAVGGYLFDLALENRIRAHVVANELQYLESLIQDVSRRIQETELGRLGTSTPDETEPKALEPVHRSVTSFLQQQLQATRGQIEPMLS